MQFQSTIIKASVIEFWVVDYSSVLIKMGLQQRQFLQNFGVEMVASYNISEKKIVHRHCPSSCRGKY